jgi:hypothetical protein
MGWDPQDQAKAKAFMLEKAARCQMCGTAAWEWDPERGGSRFAYEPVGVLCQGCYVKDGSSHDTERMPGVTIELHPTGTRESAQRLVAAQRRSMASRKKVR